MPFLTSLFFFSFLPIVLSLHISRVKKNCENIVAKLNVRYTSGPSTLTELHGVENKYVAVFLNSQRRDTSTLIDPLNITFPFNPGFPTVFNVTLSQVHTKSSSDINPGKNDNVTEGLLLLLDDPSSIDIGPVAPGGEYRVTPFDPPDVTFAVVKGAICTSRTPFSLLYDQYQGDYFHLKNKAANNQYGLTLADAK